jgi:phosphoglycolate phosphatase
MIGDTEFDVQMARSARVASVGVACGVPAFARQREAGALEIVDSVAHLGDWLRGRNVAA